ncbi:MAG: SIS domain-containing protein [Acidimicrobiales bacterium]
MAAAPEPLPTGAVVARLREVAPSLPPAERRIADALVGDPQLVAFGTVAEVAAAAGAGGASVVRLATRLGYQGSSWTSRPRCGGELADRLRPAADRIRDLPSGDVLGRAQAAAAAAVDATFAGLDRVAFTEAVDLLADAGRRVVVLAGDAGAGIAAHAGDELSMLRPGVAVVGGSPVAVGRTLAGLGRGDVVVALDLRRYDRWLLDALGSIDGVGVELVALTDGPLSPLGRGARALLVVDGEGIGPFDNYVGALALLSALVAAVAERLKGEATGSLDRIERSWRATGALTDG